MYTVMRNELEDLCQQQGNYKNLRAKIAEDQEQNKKASVDSSVTVCPIIPYLGMFLTDLTFGEEGNSDYVSTELYSADDKVIFNVSKLTLISKSIVQLRSYCAGSYPFVFCKSHHQLLCTLQVRRVLTSLATHPALSLKLSQSRFQVMGEEECYRRSKQYEASAN